MASLNKVLLMGNLTRNPEIRYTPGGDAVAEFGIAINDNYTKKDGTKVEKTTFVDVFCWGRQAETSSEYLSKGSPVFLEGSLVLEQWESKEGEKRSKLRVKAARVQFLSSGKESGERKLGAAPAQPQGEFYDEDDVPF